MAEPTPVTLEELVALLKARGVMSEPGEPAQPIVHGELALLRHAKDALEAHTQDLEAKVRELESALHAANVATRALHAANGELRIDAGNAARARDDERQGFEAQIEQLQRRCLDTEGNAVELQRVTEQHLGQIARQRDTINSQANERAELARRLDAVIVVRDRLEAENGKKQEQIQNQVTAIQALMHEKAELTRKLDAALLAREKLEAEKAERTQPVNVADALLYAATSSMWAGLQPATAGRRRYLSNAFDRAVEANMWFVKATTKDED